MTAALGPAVWPPGLPVRPCSSPGPDASAALNRAYPLSLHTGTSFFSGGQRLGIMSGSARDVACLS